MTDFLHPDQENFSEEELILEEKIRPQSFQYFAGQRKTLDNLEVFVAEAKNRGGALDLTLVDVSGNELYMGTNFDFFGIEASHNYKNLSEEILQNRILLKKIMIQNGFKSFDSEWWHYNLKNSRKFNV